MQPSDGNLSDDDARRRKHEAKIHNDRMRALADMGKVAFGALLVSGVVRYFVDPNAPPVGSLQLLSSIVGAGLMVWFVWSALDWQRPEEERRASRAQLTYILAMSALIPDLVLLAVVAVVAVAGVAFVRREGRKFDRKYPPRR